MADEQTTGSTGGRGRPTRAELTAERARAHTASPTWLRTRILVLAAGAVLLLALAVVVTGVGGQ